MPRTYAHVVQRLREIQERLMKPEVERAYNDYYKFTVAVDKENLDGWRESWHALSQEQAQRLHSAIKELEAANILAFNPKTRGQHRITVVL